MSTPEYNPPDVGTEDLNDEKKKAKKLRSALVETEGGIGGQELQSGGTGKRDTLFGN